MPDLSIRLFGPPQITRGIQQITLQRRKDLALLVYLVVTAQPHTRDTIATLLWPDSDQSLARANVRKNISRLKNDLGEEILLTTSDQISLNPEFSLWLDVKEFQSRLEQPRKHNHPLHQNGQPLCEACQSALQEAVQLHRSAFLEGFSLPDSATFDEWQYFQSEGYRQNLSDALQQLIEQYLYLEQFNPAIEHCHKWLAMDTLNEAAHKKLMLAYALSGQQSAALRQFEECSRLLKDELGIDPETETIESYEAIRDKKIPVAGEPVKVMASVQKSTEETSIPKMNNNLPVTTTPFVGRTRELGEIKKLLEEPACRVVTLLGPGGSGKTRLSIQTGISLHDENKFKDGIWFIQLAPLIDHTSIVPNIQKALSIPQNFGQENPREQLLNYLRNRQLLLILDNFEHLLNADSIGLISELINNSPHAKILITSRERLNLKGEHLFPVEGLEFPSDDAILSAPVTDPQRSAFGAIRLFEHSAQRVQPSFEITRSNVKTIARICQYVQGMPLAIELAAAWIEALSLEEIHAEVKHDLDFLRSELHDIPDRQRSLRAVFDSSWTKLSKPTRSTIKALSVFRAPFTREAAQAITGITARSLLELTNKSWLQPNANGRFQMHELLRQFALEKLICDSIVHAQIKEKYCSFYGSRLSFLWESTKGQNQSLIFSEVEQEFENLRNAFDWCLERPDFELVVENILPALFVYAEVRGKSLELREMTDRMLTIFESAPPNKNKIRTQIILLTVQGAFSHDGHPMRYGFFEGRYPVPTEIINRAWELTDETMDLHELGFWGILLSYIYGYTIDHDSAIRSLKQTILHFRNNNSVWEMATADLHLSMLLLAPHVAADPNIHEPIEQLLSEALDIFGHIGDELSAGHTLSLMGSLRMKEQKINEAIDYWVMAQTKLLKMEVNEWAAASSINWHIGDAYLQLGLFEKAFICFQEIARVNLDHGLIRQAVGALSKESFERARYGDLMDAIRIREKSLELIQESGPEYQVAWNYWEMGELRRLEGNLADSLSWFNRSREILEKYKDNIGLAFYWRGVGDLALLEGNFALAKSHFLKSVSLGRNALHNWITTYSLCTLGRIEMELADLESARKHYLEALSHAQIAHDPGIALKVLAGIFVLLERSEKVERAVEIGSFVLHHFASWNETKQLANEMLSSLQHKILPRKFNELMNKGESLELWETVDKMIGELQ